MKLDLSTLFKALSVENRLRIIQLLKTSGPMGSKRIAAELGITPAAASQHLRALKQAGLVRGERKGYWVPYSIDVRGMDDCCCRVEEICRCVSSEAVSCGTSGSASNRLESLAEYRRRLKQELEIVEEKISKLGNNKRKE